MESKPMKEAKSSAAAGKKVAAESGTFAGAGTMRPSRGEQRRGEVRMVEGESRHDHHAAERERQEHQRHDQALVERDAAEVDRRRDPEHAECDREAHATTFQRGGDGRPVQGDGNVAEKRAPARRRRRRSPRTARTTARTMRRIRGRDSIRGWRTRSCRRREASPRRASHSTGPPARRAVPRTCTLPARAARCQARCAGS